jgi:hypothetical protein
MQQLSSLGFSSVLVLLVPALPSEGVPLPARPKTNRVVRVGLVALLALGFVVAPAAAQDGAAVAADSARAAGACPQGRVTRIDVANGSVIPAAEPGAPLARRALGLVNRLHVRTRASVIRGALLFAEGDCYDPFLVSESGNLLERYDFIAHARIVTEGDSLSGRRVLVETQDEWTTRLDVGATYDAGINLENLNFVEDNLLGRGLIAHAQYRHRRELDQTLFGVRHPNAFRWTGIAAYGGRTAEGTWFYEAINHPFVGRVGRFSGLETWTSTTSLFAWATDGADPWAHVTTAVREDHGALSAATRFGSPRGLWVVGTLLTRDVYRPRAPEISVSGFDERVPPPGPLPAGIARQSVASAATRAALELGFSRSHDARYQGLDGVRDVQTVSIGWSAALVVGKSLPLLAPADIGSTHDASARFGVGGTAELGPLLLLAGESAEVRRADGAWRDLVADANVVGYLKGRALPGQTLFLRGSVAGGWWTDVPFQLTLGGRDGVRSLTDDALPGGRQLLLTAEDRIRFGWIPAGAADLGATVFTDWGRVWAGDAPYGVNSGWRGAVGLGLRLGFPTGSRNAWRPDIVFPVGPGAHGGPVFRVTMELNRLRGGFSTPDADRSRRFTLGP